MKHFFSLASLVLLGVMSSCQTDTDGIWNKINELDGRVTALEKQVSALNNDINSIRELTEALQKRLYVSSVKNTENGSVLTFSDGSTITLKNGKDGINGVNGKDAPVISIRQDSDGKYYWSQTIDGKTSWLKDERGNKILASGTNGVTPLLKVDSEGYWLVSYDSGNYYSRIKDENGNPIKAQAQDSFFKSVEFKSASIFIVLVDGSEFIISLGKQSIHQAVDLGLSVLWASCNLGAELPSDAGDLYYWGCPDKHAKVPYNQPLYFSDISGTDFDAAYTWGSKWRLPNVDEYNELAHNCTWTKATINGISGYKVTGKNGNYIFLPPTGCGTPSAKSDIGYYYWTGNSFVETNQDKSGFNFSNAPLTDNQWKLIRSPISTYKYAIRPVY